MLLSAIFSADIEVSMIGYLTYLELFLFYIIVVDLIDDRKKLEYLFKTLLAAGFVTGVYSIYNYYFKSGTIFETEAIRATGFLENANRFGYVQAFISLVTISYIWTIKNRLTRFITIAVVVTILFSSFLSLSRGLFIGLLITLIYSFTYFFKRTKIVFGFIFLFIGITAIVPGAFWNRLETLVYIDRSEGALPTRLAFIQDGFRMGLANPLTGVGLGCFKDEFLRFSDKPVSPSAGGSHNMYISIMAENGIPALIIFLLLIYRTLKKTISNKNRLSEKLRNYGIGIELSLVFSLVAGFFGTIEYSKIFWLLLAICVVPEKILNQHKIGY
jgi:putative inorganic carbon (HCO3(-)) transporter